MTLAPPRTTFLERARAAGVDVASLTRVGSLEVDLDRYEVRLAGVSRRLSALQLELLALVASAPDRVWSREALGDVCWPDAPLTRRIDIALCRIRTALGFDVFRNVRDRGWRLVVPEA